MFKDGQGRYEYPPEHVGRKRYVTVAGIRESVPVIYTFYHAGRYHLFGTAAPGDTSAMVMSDISEYRSPIDGSTIHSRSTHRAHMRQHGVIEMGNEYPKNRTPVEMARPGHDIRRAMQGDI